MSRKLYRIETNLDDATARVNSLQDAVQAKKTAAENLLFSYDQWKLAIEKKEKIATKALSVAKNLVSLVVRDAASVRSIKARSIAGDDENYSLGQSLDSMTLSSCGNFSSNMQYRVGSPFCNAMCSESRSQAIDRYDPETAWKSTHNILPHISGKIRTALMKNHSQEYHRNTASS